MENKVLWIGLEKDYDGRNTGCLIDAADVENSVYLGEDLVCIWDNIPGSQEPTIPAVIEWDGERYDSIREMINIFKTAKEAARVTGISESNIAHCISGKTKTAGGFVWKRIYSALPKERK